MYIYIYVYIYILYIIYIILILILADWNQSRLLIQHWKKGIALIKRKPWIDAIFIRRSGTTPLCRVALEVHAGTTPPWSSEQRPQTWASWEVPARAGHIPRSRCRDCCLRRPAASPRWAGLLLARNPGSDRPHSGSGMWCTCRSPPACSGVELRHPTSGQPQSLASVSLPHSALANCCLT